MEPDILKTALILVVWLILAVVVGLIARKRNRRFWPWFSVGVFNFLFAMIVMGVAEFFVGLRESKSEAKSK